VTIRPARPEDAAALHTLTLASKAVWGYAPERISSWGNALDIAEALADDGEAAVAEIDGRTAGWAQVLAPLDGIAVLDHLWVEPGSMRMGVGSALFRHASAAAVAMGARTMEWEAEPNAAGFYARMGGRIVRTTTSEWGRRLDVMAVDLC
jgi:ribosomal protein S18 acetylase RimI-like enzyme